MPVLTIDVVMELGSVIPVIVIADAGQAVSLATRLVAEGMVALEVVACERPRRSTPSARWRPYPVPSSAPERC